MASVVVVDPGEALQGTVGRALERDGHVVTVLTRLEPGIVASACDGADLVVSLAGVEGQSVADAARSAATPPAVIWCARQDESPPKPGESGPDVLLPSPHTPSTIRAAVRRALRQSRTDDSWSGVPFLDGISGPCARYQPARVAYLFHRVAAEGRMHVTVDGVTSYVDFRQGGVVGGKGLVGVLGSTRGQDLTAAIGASIGAGTPADQAMAQAAAELGSWLLQRGLDGRGVVRVNLMAPPPAQAFPLGTPVPRLLSSALAALRSPELVREELADHTGDQIQPSVPDDTPDLRWGLPPQALRLLRRLSTRPSVGALLAAEGDRGDQLVSALDLLWTLGLCRLRAARSSSQASSRERSVRDRGTASAKRVPAPEDGAIEPRRPAEAPAPTTPEDELRQTLAQLQVALPMDVLCIERVADLKEESIERAYRGRSARFHPDRFSASSAEVKELAAECFQLVSRAREILRDGHGLQEARMRLEARVAGKQYVSSADRTRARIGFAKCEAAFRRRQWDQALALVDESLGLDPEQWRADAIRLQCLWRLGKRSGRELAAELGEVAAPNVRGRAELLHICGEMLLSDGDKKGAYKLFEQVVELDPEHIESRRRLRLRQMRHRKDAPSAGSDRLSNLFRRDRE